MGFEYRKYFDSYCKESGLELQLSFDMPSGYETANGTFHDFSKTVFINANRLQQETDAVKAFYLFHELRHASQYLCPEQFDDVLNLSMQYIILYDGTCYKRENNTYLMCKLEGSEEYFTNLYLGQPYEVDANTFAYEQVRKIYGDSEKLKRVFDFWMPHQVVPNETYHQIFALIDKNTK